MEQQQVKFDPSTWAPGMDLPDADALQRTLAEIERQDREDFAKQRADRYAVLRNASGIPECYAGAVPSMWEVDRSAPEAIRRAQEQAGKVAVRMVSGWQSWRQRGDFLLLSGPEGTGKTLLSAIIGNGLLSMGVAVRYVAAAGASDAVRFTYGTDARTTERALMDAWLGADLLILDELGAQTTSPHDLKVTWGLVNGRYLARKPMVVVTNFATADLESRLGPNIVGRILERSADRMRFDMVWPSWRRRGL